MEDNLTKPITFRPTEYDSAILTQIMERNPHISTPSDLIRIAIRTYDIEANDENSKGKRLQQIKERLDRLEAKLEALLTIIVAIQKGAK